MKKANYYSPEFYKILETINSVLTKNNLDQINAADGKVSASKFNIGTYGNMLMWRITNKEFPKLLNAQLMFDIKAALSIMFPQYINTKAITIGNPQYTKDSTNTPMASIVIMITELSDNIITLDDLMAFEADDPEAVNKCLEIEHRMFRRDNDIRDSATRIKDFAFSLIYEPKLVSTKLFGIHDLTLKHQVKAVTLETDANSDFSGFVNNKLCNIEGKSTKDSFNYEDNLIGHLEFAAWFQDKADRNVLGNFHNADYILLVIKDSGFVICINVLNFADNWLAGIIKL